MYLVPIYSTLHESRGERVPHVVQAEVWNACPTAQSHHATVDVTMITPGPIQVRGNNPPPPGRTREAVEAGSQPIRQSELKSGGRPQGNGTDRPILGRNLSPVHRLYACGRLVIDCGNPRGIDGPRGRAVYPGRLPRSNRQRVRLGKRAIHNQRMIGYRGDRRGERSPNAAASRMRINGRDLIHAEITRGRSDAIAGEGSRPGDRNRRGTDPGRGEIPELGAEGTTRISAQIGADFRERKSTGGHGSHGDISRYRIPCLRADCEEAVRAIPDRMGPTDRIGGVPRG